MPDIFVQTFSHLKDKHNADKALEILKRVASLVKPIMRKRNWVLPVLAEFFPDNANLLGLNINMGQKILVRLRPHYDPDTFLPEESIVGTMLHELTHNVHGPHDDKFYKYLSDIQDEYDALQRSGYAGEGFFSEGRRLGANVSHNDPPHIARRKALEAAEKRRQSSRVLGSGGRLGGRNKDVGLSPRELAVRAAERRIRDEKSCASGPEAQREAEKATKESKIIDLTLDDMNDDHPHYFDSDSDVVIVVEDVYRKPPSSSLDDDHLYDFDSDSDVVIVVEDPSSSAIAGPSSSVNPQRTERRSKPSGSSSSSNTNKSHINNYANKIPIRKTSYRPQTQLVEWSCQVCTLLNPYVMLRCEACEMPRPF